MFNLFSYTEVHSFATLSLCNLYKLSSINVGPPHPTLLWSPTSLESATQQRLFAFEAEKMLTKLMYIGIVIILVVTT